MFVFKFLFPRVETDLERIFLALYPGIYMIWPQIYPAPIPGKKHQSSTNDGTNQILFLTVIYVTFYMVLLEAPEQFSNATITSSGGFLLCSGKALEAHLMYLWRQRGPHHFITNIFSSCEKEMVSSPPQIMHYWQ